MQIYVVTLLLVYGRCFFFGASSDVFLICLLFDDRLTSCVNWELYSSVAIEGWTILVSGVKEDAEEDDLYNAFSEFGHVKDLHLNLERRTGYAKVNLIALLWEAKNKWCSLFVQNIDFHEVHIKSSIVSD
jgi:hypothetical protein